MSMKIPKKKVLRCAECGEDQDLSYIVWEGRYLCAPCFGIAAGEYARKYPFMMAEDLGLDVVHVPEQDAV